MSDPFEILEHTADTGFRAWGSAPAELFENAALAMLSIAAETDRVDVREQITVETTGEDYESLLVNWLNEVVYLFDSDRFAPKEFHVEAIEPTRLRAKVGGEPRDPQRHPWKLIVKAVTYHKLEVAQRNGHWEAQVYLDI